MVEWAAAAPAAGAASDMPQVVNGAVVRNAQLDRYLDAHKQYFGSSALGPSPGFLRSATYETPSR
jgi:phage-related protein